MSIPLFQTHISPEAVAAAVETLGSGWLGQGAKVAAFEAAFAKYVGAAQCVAVNRGTSALHLALHVLDLPPGSEVITSPLTFVATHHAVHYVGCTPVLADIQLSSGNLDPASVRSKITERTRALLPVHYAGYPCDLAELYVIAAEYGLAVIEDCAHATGATYRGAPIGSSDTLQCFSFSPTKNLTMGEGGAITTQSPRHIGRLKDLRYLGLDRDTHERQVSRAISGSELSYEVMELGFRYHLSDLNAAIGLAQLPHVQVENERRAAIAGAYRSGLGDVAGLQLLDYKDDRRSSYFMYPVLVEHREDLIERLRGSGIEVGVHYPANNLLHRESDGDLPNTRHFRERTLTLPLHPLLSDADVQFVIDCVRDGW